MQMLSEAITGIVGMGETTRDEEEKKIRYQPSPLKFFQG